MNNDNFDIDAYIKNLFDCKDFFMAYMLEILAYGDVFVLSPDKQLQTFNMNKLIKKLSQINTSYVTMFADRFGVNANIALNSLKYICNLDTPTIKQKIDYNFGKLLHNSKFKELLQK